jgi:hypothetical protein
MTWNFFASNEGGHTREGNRNKILIRRSVQYLASVSVFIESSKIFMFMYFSSKRQLKNLNPTAQCEHVQKVQMGSYRP